MKKIFSLIIISIILFSTGCRNFSPRLNQKNVNPNGDVNNNQQGMMIELGKIRKETEILSSNLREIQEGLINLNAAVSKNENSGIQILQGDGSLIMIFGLGVLLIVFYFKNKNNQEAVKILTKKIIDFDNDILTKSVVEEFSSKNKDKQLLKILKSIK